MIAPEQRQSLACVIVTYNRKDDLRRCLSHTLSQDVDVVVVIDNASTDETPILLAEVQSQDKRLFVERQGHCRGGSWGFARGMRWADRLLQGRGWLLLYDDDSWPEPGCIDTFRKAAPDYQQQGVAAVGAAVLDTRGRPVESNRPVLNLFRRPGEVLAITSQGWRCWRDFYHVPHRILLRRGQQVRVDAISFVGLFLQLEALPRRRGRYPRGGLFLYSDDTTYTLDLGRKGRRMILDSDLIFRHNTTGGGAAATWLNPLWKHYYVVRNSFLMNHSLSSSIYLPLCVITVAVHAYRAVLRIFLYGDARLWKLVWLAAYDGVRNNYSRRHAALTGER